MSYRIDDGMTYWGGKKLCGPIKPASEETVEACIKAFESFSKEVKRETELLLRMEDTSRDIKKTLETIDKLEQIAMEEKKTKKMTKAEAFEWLKNKKIRCIDGSGNHFLTIMSILENIGFRWSGTNRYEDYQVFCLFTSHNGRVTYLDIANAHEFNDEPEEEVLMEDILSLEIEEEKCGSQCSDSAWEEIGRIGAQISAILRSINGHYHVEITDDDVNLYAEGVNLYHSDPF